MSHDKELEIQLQFLEEAQDYLDTIESVLLGISSSQISSHDMDAVLRAAHSVKGGAGMMGFSNLSHLAHRLEDSFKVLKAQKNSIDIDAELERLLLSGVDRLRQVLDLNRQGTEVDQHWLDTVGNPVFEQLHDRLGDPQADDAATILGTDDSTDVAALLFESEVEGCLVRLESVLADPQLPCLEEELSILAQELEGLGEMLQLEAFSSLCRSVLEHLSQSPQQVKAIAELALSSWRQSQALVIAGQTTSLPSQIDWVGEGAVSPPEVSEEEVSTPTAAEDDMIAAAFDAAGFDSAEDFDSVAFNAADVAAAFEQAAAAFETVEINQAVEAEFADHEQELEIETEVTQTEAEISESAVSFAEDDFAELEEHDEFHQDAVAEDSLSVSDQGVEVSDDAAEEVGDEEFVSAEPSIMARSVPAVSQRGPAANVDWQPEKAHAAKSAPLKESQENTVRVPVRQLDRLDDLFGELTIERNGLGLQLTRLRGLIETLSHRVSTLEQSNSQLRSAYDRVATQASRVPELATSLAAIAAPTPDVPLALPPGDASDDQNWDEYSANNGESVESLKSKFDSLEMDRYSDLHLLSRELMETIVQIEEVKSDIELGLEDADQTSRELNRTAKQLQTNLTRLRMRPLSDLMGRYTRAIRDLCLQHGKQVDLKFVGKGVLIDRSILEALSDPLMHLIRNAFDHGIEDPQTRRSQGKSPTGVIEVKAAHRGNQTIITISDDGKGINLNKIRKRAEDMGLDAELLAAASEDDLLSLIFEPGFSTAEKVTSLSGRGVGMDVVRNNLKEIRGDIRVDTRPGQGTTFTLTVPFTLSVARVLLVESNGMQLAFPTDVIEEMILLQSENILTTPGSEILNWQDEMIRLIRLGQWLTFYCPRRVMIPDGLPSINEPTVLMINQADQLLALQVDRCWGEREVAIRHVEGPMPMPPGFSSCTILGDGKVVPLVDTGSLLRWIASNEGPTEPRREGEGVSAAPSTPSEPLARLMAESNNSPPIVEAQVSHRDTILVVDDSINVRRFLALALEKAGYLVEQAKDGQDAVEKLLGGLSVSAVICDIEMPRLDGYGFLARIKSNPKFGDLPVAMLTSRSGEKHRRLAMTLGASAYFSKPYNERELLETLKQLTATRVTT